MLRDKVIVACALLLLSSLIFTMIPVKAVEASTSDVILSEDAEEATYDEWNARWTRSDLNSASGDDYFCRLAHNNHGGSHAIYASRVGFNSHYLVPVTMADGSPAYTQAWNVNATGLSGETSQSQWVPRYDTNQDSVMRKAVVGASNYGTVTLTFWFWSDTGASDAKQPLTGASVGYDFLNVVYWTGSGDSSTKQVLWTDSSAQASAKGWTYATVQVPNTVTYIGFEFVSGTTAPEGGDATDAFASSGVKIVNGGMREGVYLDDITLTGSSASDGPIVMETSVDNLAQVQARLTFNVPYTANYPTVPIEHVSLYYRQGTSGDWKYYGNFTSSPISFTATSDGTYQFYTRAWDTNGAGESQAEAPDATTIVDTTAPTTTISVTGTSAGTNTYSGSASFTLDYNDASSGVNATYYRVDSGSWILYDGSTVTLTNGGAHQVQYYSIDRAGHTEEKKSQTLTIETTNPVVTFPEPAKKFTSSTATVRFQVTGSSDITELWASLDGGKNSSIDSSLSSITFTDLTAGSHHVIIWAKDSDGRWGQNMTTFTVDLSNPTDSTDSGMTLTLGELSSSYNEGDTVHLNWTCIIASGEIDHYSILVDGDVVATLRPQMTSYDLNGLTAGSHEISVLAVNSNGNTTEQSVTVMIRASGSGGSDGGSWGISPEMLIIGGLALFGVVAAIVLVYMRSRKMY